MTIHRLHGLGADGKPIELPAGRRATLLAHVARHYRDMGVDPGLVALADRVPPETERVLDRATLRATRLTTR